MSAVHWRTNGSLDAGYLFRESHPIHSRELHDQWLRVDYMNQTPTSADPDHHVYEVGIRPFDKDQSFTLAESIHGGFYDPGGSLGFSLEELLRHPGWEKHFERSGCAWAAKIVRQNLFDKAAVLDKLVKEVCRRAGEGAMQKRRRA